VSLKINTNVSAFNTHRNLTKTDNATSKSLEKLSSGLRVNHAADDAAAAEIAQAMTSQVRGLAEADQNTQDGLNMLNTADQALGDVNDSLQRMRELVVQSANGTYSSSDRAAINAEAGQLVDQIQSVAQNTSFNGKNLIDGTFDATSSNYGGNPLTFQVGPNSGNTLTVQIPDLRPAAAGLGTDNDGDGKLTAGGPDVLPDLSTQNSASTWLSNIDNVISTVNTARGQIGAASNQLQSSLNETRVAQENQMAAVSRIQDVDMASELTNLTQQQILGQSGMAMLAQGNLQSQNVLRLLS
jgi:flagellin